jgi:hypothetical protein
MQTTERARQRQKVADIIGVFLVAILPLLIVCAVIGFLIWASATHAFD